MKTPAANTAQQHQTSPTAIVNERSMTEKASSQHDYEASSHYPENTFHPKHINPRETGMTISRFNPNYVQITQADAAEILGLTEAEFNHRRQTDPRCPTGFKYREHWMAPAKFRLSDIYSYSETLMRTSLSAEAHHLTI